MHQHGSILVATNHVGRSFQRASVRDTKHTGHNLQIIAQWLYEGLVDPGMYVSMYNWFLYEQIETYGAICISPIVSVDYYNV